MKKRFLVLGLLVLLTALPLSASQFIRLPFDRVVKDSAVVVRGVVGPVESSWDANGDVIYSRSLLKVTSYINGFGPTIIPLREVGGTVDGYTQEAIGFPALREGEEVVLFLNQWDDGADYRITAYSQGKYLVRIAEDGTEMVMPDPVEQGTERERGRIRMLQRDADQGTPFNDFVQMIDAANRGRVEPRVQQ